MLFRITKIDLDFSDAFGSISEEEQKEVTEKILATTWEACDADDLEEEITTATGWCIKSIDHCYVLTQN